MLLIGLLLFAYVMAVLDVPASACLNAFTYSKDLILGIKVFVDYAQEKLNTYRPPSAHIFVAFFLRYSEQILFLIIRIP